MDFEHAVLPHLDAAYNLARWLTRHEQAAEDLAQESLAKAFKAYSGFRGENPRAWLLAIVRNTCYTWLSKNKAAPVAVALDDDIGTPDAGALDPAALLARSAEGEAVRQALEELPPEFREAIVLRELEGLSYAEIAQVAGAPIGTVMSRLARARGRLERALSARAKGEL